MASQRTLVVLALLISSLTGHGDPRGSLGPKAAKFAICHFDGTSRNWSQSILLLWLESGESGQVVLSIVPEGRDGEQMLPIALKLISAEQANKLAADAVDCRDAALSEAGPSAAGSQPKTMMFIQGVTATNYGANLPHARFIPLDPAPKAHARFSKFLQDAAKK